MVAVDLGQVGESAVRNRDGDTPVITSVNRIGGPPRAIKMITNDTMTTSLIGYSREMTLFEHTALMGPIQRSEDGRPAGEEQRAKSAHVARPMDTASPPPHRRRWHRKRRRPALCR